MEFFLGIQNYKPKFYTLCNELIDEQKGKLHTLVGKNISEVWVVWDTKHDEFFAECPVLLQIENHQLELCAYRLDEFSITWNSIDITRKISWYGMDNEFHLEWSKNPILGLEKILNKPISKINILEYKHQTTIIKNKTDPTSIGKSFHSGWFINGIEFHFEDNAHGNTNLTVSNGLDENDISFNLWRGPDFKVSDIY